MNHRGRDKDKGSPRQLFVALATLFIVGIALSIHVDVGRWIWLGCVAVGVGAVLIWGRWWSVAMAMLSLGGFVAMSDPLKPVVGDGVECVVRVVTHQQLEVESYRDAESGEWRSSNERLYFGVDSSVEPRPEVSDRYIMRLWPKGEGESRRYTYINRAGILSQLQPLHNLGRRASEANNWAVERLMRLSMSDDAESLATAMLLGRRERVSAERKAQYVGSGNAHLLAVSGLHVGLLAAVVAIVLRPLYLLRRGVVWSRIALIAFVAGYAVLVGLSPSVMRAAMMAMVLAVSVVVTRRYNLLTSVAVAAVLALCIEPRMIFDVSFVLTFISMVAIAVWVVPLARGLFGWTLKRGWSSGIRWLVNAVVGVVILSVGCTLATAPYVAYTFGRVAMFGALASPVLTLTSGTILVVSLLWVLVGVECVGGVAGWLLERVAEIQNGVVAWFCEGWRGSVEIELSVWWMVAIYLIYGLASIVGYILLSHRDDYRGWDEC